MIVRTDLPPEQQLVQACHAAYEAGRRLPAPTPTPDDASDASTDYSVICAVDSEQELLNAHRHLARRQIPTVLFTEADLDDQATALAAAPVIGKQRKAFAMFRLWTPAEPNKKPRLSGRGNAEMEPLIYESYQKFLKKQ